MHRINIITQMASPSHFVLFPFMSKGHTIPLLHLTLLLLRRGVTVTVFTTKANRTFIARFLHRHASESDSVLLSIIDLPYPSNVEGIPHGIESTHKLPSMSLFHPFVAATNLMQPHFEQALVRLSDVTCIVSDAFLTWTLASANKFGIPRFSFFGINGYSSAVTQQVMMTNRLLTSDDDELITVPRFPWIKVTKNDFPKSFSQPDESSRIFREFVTETIIGTANSYGLIMNTFYELEPMYLDYLNLESKPKIWCVGPLCLAESAGDQKKREWMKWLDQKLIEGCSVLYVAFGSQTEISTQQLEAIAKGLEDSQVNFLWVMRKYETSNVFKEVEFRVGERGMIVTEWVDQREILKHESVKGFLSHCGWNSVVESICSEVPIIAWPMMAEQPLNAMMVVDEIKIGLRVENTCDGFVTAEGLKKTVKDLMEGEKGKEVRKKVKEVSLAAKEAMAEGGSSWKTLNDLIKEVQSNVRK